MVSKAAGASFHRFKIVGRLACENADKHFAGFGISDGTEVCEMWKMIKWLLGMDGPACSYCNDTHVSGYINDSVRGKVIELPCRWCDHAD